MQVHTFSEMDHVSVDETTSLMSASTYSIVSTLQEFTLNDIDTVASPASSSYIESTNFEGNETPCCKVTKPLSTDLVEGVRQCRFCLGEEGEDPELGKLLTPCLCRDTVHTACLQTWRATNAQAFYR
jgi:hypothetical protein